jgi:hypothetical protein
MAELSRVNSFSNPTSTPTTTKPSDVRTFDEPAEASFKDLPLWCTAMRKRHASAVARHRYPNVPGQTIEALGREPIEVELEVAFFGDDWRDRLEDLVYLKDSEQTSGRLVLPDGRGEFDAFLVEMSEDVDLTFSGATVSLRFEEDAHVDSYIVASVDDLAAAESDIPDSAPEVATGFSEYEALCSSTGTVPTLETYASLNSLESLIVAAQGECDTTTTAGIANFLALGRVQYRARRAFPDQDFLIDSLTG